MTTLHPLGARGGAVDALVDRACVMPYTDLAAARVVGQQLGTLPAMADAGLLDSDEQGTLAARLGLHLERVIRVRVSGMLGRPASEGTVRYLGDSVYGLMDSPANDDGSRTAQLYRTLLRPFGTTQ